MGFSLLLFSACDSDDGPSRLGNGRISATLDVDDNVLSAVIPEDGASVHASGIDTGDFSVTLRSIDGAFSKTWERFSDFPADGLYNIGDYIMEASYGSIDKEGFDAPYYYGERSLTVREAETTPVQIVCSLANSMVSVSATEAFRGYFSDYSTLIHSDGGQYLQYAKDESRPVYVRPGNVTFTVSVTKPNGLSASFSPQMPITALPKHHYRVKLDVNGGDMGDARLVITFDDSTETEDIVIDLSDDLMSSPAPQIFATGFISGQPVSITEGAPASTKLSATISAGAPLARVILSSRVPSLQAAGIPSELDLMAATDRQKSLLEDMGLDVRGLWRNPDKMAEIDFTDFVANIHPSDGGNAVFSLMAVDMYGKSSEPVSLVVNFNEVSLSAAQLNPIMVGNSTAVIKVSPSDSMADASRLTLSGKLSSGRWADLPLVSIADNADEWLVTFETPAGVEDLPVRLLYNGVVKCEIIMERQSPRFDMEVDPFATSAVIRVIHPDSEVSAAIARQVEIVDAAGRKFHIVRRDIAKGLVTISGLSPDKSYEIKATALHGNPKAAYTDPIRFNTEKASTIPNGDFESAKLIDEFHNIPSGGKYSQTHVGIYNHQNYWSTDLYLPDGGWATVNDKTMCKDARHKNTWYQQLSSMIVNDSKSGSKAMMLTNVGWDVDGGPIENYAQQIGEFLPYNPNVPKVAYRAAGKLFLGKYSYSAASNTEVYDEGIAFKSRPSALTGYYKYMPARDLPLDRGCVTIVLYRVDDGRETVVASTTAELPLAPGYTSFNVPLEYPVFGLRPTHLKVMFSSSVSVGSIDYETANVPLVNDFQAAAARGSSLWIDNISFAY